MAKLGSDLNVARRKRHFTAEMIAERVGVAKATYLKVEKGDPTVSMGVYAMTLFVLGFPNAFADISDPRRDDAGLLLDLDRLPKRVRVKKEPTAYGRRLARREPVSGAAKSRLSYSLNSSASELVQCPVARCFPASSHRGAT